MSLTVLTRRTITSAAIVVTIAALAAAQTQSPAYLQIRVDHVKRAPGIAAQMDAFQKDVTAADKKGGGPFRVVLSSYVGELGTYISITPMQSLGEMDGEGRVSKALGAEAYKALNDRAAGILGGPSRRMIAVPQPELNIVKERKAPGKFTIWSEYRVAGGRANDWLAHMKNNVLPALQKSNIETMYVFRVIYGGNGATFIIARTVTSLAELDGGPVLTKAVGAEAAAQINAKGMGITTSVISGIYRLRTELGNWPPASASGN